MKEVLLDAGQGNRLFPLTEKTSKLMIKIAGRPLLEWLIRDLVQCGVNEICLVIGHYGNQIKEYFRDGRNFQTKISYVEQKEFLGTANALECAKGFVGNEPFLVYLSDTIIPDLKIHLENMIADSSEISILSGMVSESEIQSVGNIQLDGDYVSKISEKSKNSQSNLAWAGVATFKSGYIFDIIEKLNPSSWGEFEITDAMNNALALNKKIKNHLCEKFVDFGTPEGLLEGTKLILENEGSTAKISEKTDVSIIQPSYIGKNCKVGQNVKIGPFVSIGENVSIGNNVTISNSLILDNSEIEPNNKIMKKITAKNCQF